MSEMGSKSIAKASNLRADGAGVEAGLVAAHVLGSRRTCFTWRSVATMMTMR